MEIWMEILKVPSLTIEDNFFALGGSSFLALRMMTQIEKLCGRPLPLSLLLTGATISNLARYIVEANTSRRRPLSRSRPKASASRSFSCMVIGPAVAFIADVFPNSWATTSRFTPSPPYRSEELRILPLSEMAAYHITAMREHTPKGPYLLGGYCIGATVAIEMGRQLVLQGEEVTQLLLIDPPQWLGSGLRALWPFVDKGGDILKWDLQKKIYYFDRYAVSLARWLKRSPANKYATLCRRLGIAKPKAGTTR